MALTVSDMVSFARLYNKLSDAERRCLYEVGFNTDILPKYHPDLLKKVATFLAKLPFGEEPCKSLHKEIRDHLDDLRTK